MTFWSPFLVGQGRPIVHETVGPWWLGPWPAPFDTVPTITSTVTAVYQPKGAAGTIYERTVANYAASKLNLNNPAIHILSDGVNAPSWAAATGWTGNGTQWLESDIVAGNVGQDNAAFCAFSTAGGAIFGASQPTPDHRFYVFPAVANYANCSVSTSVGAGVSTGVVGFTQNHVFQNGINVGVLGAFVANMTITQNIIGYNVNGAAATSPSTIMAIVYYAQAISLAQAAALSWAMEIIRSA